MRITADARQSRWMRFITSTDARQRRRVATAARGVSSETTRAETDQVSAHWASSRLAALQAEPHHLNAVVQWSSPGQPPAQSAPANTDWVDEYPEDHDYPSDYFSANFGSMTRI